MESAENLKCEYLVFNRRHSDLIGMGCNMGIMSFKRFPGDFNVLQSKGTTSPGTHTIPLALEFYDGDPAVISTHLHLFIKQELKKQPKQPP